MGTELVMVVGGRYEVERELGQGRLSVVYRARDRETGQVVALKVLQAHLREQASVVQRFRREMAAVQRLDHEAIVRVFDIVETEEHLALVMEYAPGVDLKSWVRTHGSMGIGRVVTIGSMLLEGLGQAHARGVLHRDLSLANVILEEGSWDRIEVIGFGLARVDELVGLTMHTRVLGTLETMAPECVLGKAADARADLYSVGAMLFELLVGRPLHDGRMSSGLQFAMRADSLDEVRAELVDAGVAGGLLHTVLRALVADPGLRFATAEQMRSSLLGGYDSETWLALEAHEGEACPACDEELVEGVGHCLYCGHVLKRLIREPGAGGYYIGIVAPGKTRLSEFRTELVGDDQVQALAEVMSGYEDTRHVFRLQSLDRKVPYLLFDDLSKADAARVSAALKERGVGHIAGQGAVLSHFSGMHGQELSMREGGQGADGEARSFGITMVLTIGWLGVTFLVGFVWAFLMVGLFLVGWRVGDWLGRRHAEHLGMETEDFPVKDDGALEMGVRLPTYMLSYRRRQRAESLFAGKTTAFLKDLKDADLRREYHEVLVFAARLFRDSRVPVLALQEVLEPMLSHAGGLLKRLGDLQSRGGERSTAELFDALARLDARLLASEDMEETARLIAERGEVLETMADLDARVHAASLLRGHLLRVRAALLDLQQEFGGVALPSLEVVKAEVLELTIGFEAEREVHALLEGA